MSRKLALAGSRSLQASRWVETDQLRGKLRAGEVLVTIARFPVRSFDLKAKGLHWDNDRYAAWIIPAAGKGEVRVVDLGLAQTVDDAIVSFHSAIRSVYTHDEETQNITSSNAKAIRSSNAAVQYLSRLILHPVLNTLPIDAHHLLISPEAGMWLVPWAALKLPDGRYSVENYLISHVISGREMVAAPRPGTAEAR